VLVLGIDTSTAATSVGLVNDDGVLASRAHVDARRHAEVLPGLVRSVLAEASATPRDLAVVGCGVGPGPFTGLRVGITFGRAMAQALSIPVVGVCSLDALAASVADGEPFTVRIRVRRAEHAWATYDGDGVRTTGPLVSRDDDGRAVGRTVGDCADVDSERRPSGTDVASLVRARLALGERPPAELLLPEDEAAGSGSPTAEVLTRLRHADRVLLPAVPLYLRRPDAIPTAQR